VPGVAAPAPPPKTATPDSRASTTPRALRRREEDENPQLLGDQVKPRGPPRRHEVDAARLHLAVLVAHANGRSAGDDVIDLVLPVRLLRIDAASREDVQADAEGGPAKEFEIELLRSEEHTSELQSRSDLVCRLLLEKKN